MATEGVNFPNLRILIRWHLTPPALRAPSPEIRGGSKRRTLSHMRLYYFTTTEHGLMAIRDQRIKLAEIDKLNDPFECLALDLSDPEVKRRSEGWKEKIFSKEHLFLCLSKNWNHPLMWSHYAQNHKGMCLCLEADNEILSKVSYISQRIKRSLEEIQNLVENEDPIFLDYVTLYKAKVWSYEREYRIISPRVNADPVNLLYFRPFDEKLKLTKVLLGPKSEVSIDRVKLITNAVNSKIEIIKTKLSETKFQVIES